MGLEPKYYQQESLDALRDYLRRAAVESVGAKQAFVALLRDGRYLVVEYRGSAWLGTPDSAEKMEVGEMWAERCRGRCVFRMVGRDEMEEVIREAVAVRTGTTG